MKKSAKAKPANGASNGRVKRSKDTVLAATVQLMSEEGLSGVTIDTVSERSGVAKTTIYRHWSSRTELLLDACTRLGGRREPPERPPPPDTGSLQGDAQELALNLARQLKTAKWALILPSVIDMAERSQELAAIHSRMHSGFMQGFYAVIERARKRGEMPKGRTPPDLVASLVGPLLYRRYYSREPLDGKFIGTIVSAAVRS